MYENAAIKETTNKRIWHIHVPTMNYTNEQRIFFVAVVDEGYTSVITFSALRIIKEVNTLFAKIKRWKRVREAKKPREDFAVSGYMCSGLFCANRSRREKVQAR